MNPPPYPRIPHLRQHAAADADDLVLSPAALEHLSGHVFRYEEKLDGFNIAITADDQGWPQPFARSGKSHGDRGGQLGRIRAWISDHAAPVQACLQGWPVLYGEWMLRRHSVRYDALPDWLIVLDLWHPDRGFASPEERDRLCRLAGLTSAPAYGTEPWRGEERMENWCRRSLVATGPAEGIVLRDPSRPEAGAIAKWLAPHFRRRTDAEWTDEQNHLEGEQGPRPMR